MKTMLNIKIDAKLKMQAKKTAEELGMPLSTVASALIRQFVREKEIHLSIPLKPSKYLVDVIEEAEQELKQGKAHGPYHGVDELMKALKK